MKRYFKIVIFLWIILLSKDCISQTIVICHHPALPSYFLIVDKQKQLLYLFGENGNIIKQVPCSTGANTGDKLTEGDERTPEGIYFLTERVKDLSNYELYGGIAYKTNYPNPIDRLFGKNGHGIWLHGRGKKLVPFDTKGCVAVATPVLEGLKKYIHEDMTPILIAQHIEIKDKDPSCLAEINRLRHKVLLWKLAWKDKDVKFFDFYDQHLFARTSHKPFTEFIREKLHYFSIYKWIDIYIPKVFILKGPYYFVVYFYQYFRSPKFQSQGIKRLYWMKIDGDFKIVASEWKEKRLHLKTQYLAYNRERIKSFLLKWKSAWENKDIEKYKKFYDKHAIQDKRKGLASILKYKQRIWSREGMISLEFKDIHISLCKQGFKVEFIQHYKTDKYEDVGEKSLVVYPTGPSFKISSECWRKL